MRYLLLSIVLIGCKKSEDVKDCIRCIENDQLKFEQCQEDIPSTIQYDIQDVYDYYNNNPNYQNMHCELY